MSWAVEEWKDGLPVKALQKIQEMEVHLDKLKKERTQKQFKLDSLEAALQKQKQKADIERTESSALKRENQSLVESCDSLEKSRQKLAHDLGIKEQQVSYLEGQLNSCRKTTECLEQELKKYKNELERSQSAGSSLSSSSELQPYTTPQKSIPTPLPVTANRHQDNRLEGLEEEYNLEVKERKKLETELKVLQVKLENQSSATVSHKDFVARQAGSSIFPWQQDQAHSWQIQDAVETPVKRRGTSLWDVHEETPIKPSQRMSSLQSPARSCQQMEQLKTLNQELCGRVSELERILSTQQKDICNQASKLQELQTLLVQARKELTERDRDLTKTSHDLSQAESKCSMVEEKLKQMAEEMSCQRHNAESCRRVLEQKLKDQERASQEELAQLQGSHQTLEQQLDQTRTKLTQEIQQSKKDLNFLQADMEKMCFQKNQMMKELKEQKQKLLRSEQNLQACQNKEHDVQKKIEELQKEKNSLTVQLDQSSRCLTQLEEEKKKTEQLLKCTHGLLDDLKAKSEGQTEELNRIRSKLEHQTQMSASELLNMNKALCDAETKTERAQNELDKHKQKAEKLANRLTLLGNENQEQKSNITAGQKECDHLKKEIQALLDWKKEKETLINYTETIQKELNEKIVTLEKSLISANEVTDQLKLQNVSIEEDKASLSAHLHALKGELLSKCTKLEERDHQFMTLQAEFSETGQKHAKDFENIAVQVKQLEAQVKELEVQLQEEVTRAGQAKRINLELRGEHQAACDLVQSKNRLLELGQAEIIQLRESLSQAIAQQEEQGARLADEREALLTQCEETVSLKVEGIEQLKWQLEAAQQELLLFKDQVTSMDLCKEVKGQLEAELQKQITKLLDQEEEHRKIYEIQSEEIRQLKDVLKELHCCLEDEQKLLRDSEAQISSLKKQNTKLENAAQETETLREAQVGEINSLLEQISFLQQELTVTQDAVKGLQLLNDELDMVNHSHAELKKCMEDLGRSHSSTLEIKSNLENNLTEKNSLIITLKVEVQKLKEQMCQDAESHTQQINNCLNKQRWLQEQLDEAKKIETATKAESKSQREEIKTMKTTLSAASQCLEERDDLIESLKEKLCKAEEEQAKTSDLLREKVVSMNKVKVQMEMLQMDLEDNEMAMNTFNSQVEELKATRDTLNSQLGQKQLQISDMEAKLEEYKAQVSVLETRLEEVQSQNSLLEMQYITAKEELTERSCEVTCLEEGAVKISQLNETVAALQLKLGHITEENNKLEKLRQIMEGKDSDINQLLQDKHILETKVKQLIDEKERVDANIIQVNAQKNHLEASLNTLTEENQELQSCMKWITEEKDKIDEVVLEKLEAKSSLRQVTEEKTQLAATLSLLDQDKIQLETEVKELAIEESNTVAKLNQVVDEKLQLSCQCDQLTKENIHLQSSLHKLAEDKLLMQGSIQKFEKEMISLEDKNKCIQSALLSSQQMVEILKEQLETQDKGAEERRERSKQFEVQQVALHQQLLVLQMELAAMRQLYDSLLEQVSQQNGFIQQLSDLQKTLKSEDNVSGRESKKTETVAGQMNADMTEDTSVESLPEMEQLSCEVAELKEHSHQSEEDFCETQLVHKEHTGDKMMQECLDVAKNVCVPDPLETVEEQHLQQTEALNTSLSGLPSSSLPESSQSEISEKASPQVRDYLNNYKNIIISQENQLQQLYAEFDLLKSDLMLRMELTSELQAEVQNWEKKFQRAEEEKLVALHKLNITLENHKVVTDQLTRLSEEKETLALQLQTSKCQLTDVIEMLGGLQMTKGGWDDKFLQQESELKRVRSEKSNLEQHILGMESDLENLQEERTKLKTEVETQRKVCSGMEQEIDTLRTELTQLRAELVSCSEERDDLNQSLGQWRNKVDTLERTNCDTRNLISILEDDIRTGRREHKVLKTSIEELASEKQQLLEQIKTLELAISEQNGERQELIGQLDKITEDHLSAHQNTETMVGKIQALEGEVYHLSQSLEASLVEKGEIASRLNSTQDEVQQMRTDIEKLYIRIESDERKKKKMRELLKAAQRKSDSLQDHIDALVREHADIESSLEEAVLQAETSKEELEEERRKVEEEKMVLSNKLSEFSIALQHLRSEKKHVELELKNREIEDLKAAKEDMERGLERAEAGKRQKEERQKHRVEQLEKEVKEDAERITRQLDDLRDQLQACHQRELYLEGKSIETEADKERLKSLLADLEMDKNHLQTLLEELQTGRDSLCSQTAERKREIHNLKTDINTLKEERNDLKIKIKAKEEERENLQCSLVSLQGEKERIEQESQVLVFDKEKLQSYLCLIEKEKQEMQQILSSLKEEKDSIEEERNDLAAEREELLSLLFVVEKEKNDLSSITSSLEQENQNVEEKKEKLTGDQGRLQSTVASVQEQLEMCKPSVSKRHEQVSDRTNVVTRLSKERDSALSKMSRCMKTCKQLEQEKEVMLNSIDEVKNNAAQMEISQLQHAEKRNMDMEDLKMVLQQKKNEVEEQTKEVDELKAALIGREEELMERNGELQELKNELTKLKNILEVKSMEADESMDKYCNLMVQVHKLEETNAALTTRLEQLSASQNANNGKVVSDCVQHQRFTRKLAIKPREENLAVGNENTAPSTPLRIPQGSKRGHSDLSEKARHLPDLDLTKKIKTNLVNGAQEQTDQEDEDFRPEGLPELVQKGFADIPVGEASPFIIRRTTVKHYSSQLAGRHSVPTPVCKVLGPVSIHNPSKDSHMCLSPKQHPQSLGRTPEQKEKQTHQGDNCHVQ
ncbi:centromere protein F isoform X1 [Takifugu rubripes]|uniref:Centromere protein F n=1 Tax=Takifugu rubripes TaxID=31033 RepID=H2TCJ9_TAKRU|nr:centromere protein F isoform X1 [Takifugu rubripes]XP_011607921.1 centromere protein F isoform X1 [Takifugu rubripes]XP_029702004.1 centromere protein F isoform X1 [Takifugu rubripes]|eukprot:XP_011607920.1 PREDICTED: centromere protein F isoform X1 [Takifugu rubripes]